MGSEGKQMVSVNQKRIVVDKQIDELMKNQGSSFLGTLPKLPESNLAYIISDNVFQNFINHIQNNFEDPRKFDFAQKMLEHNLIQNEQQKLLKIFTDKC